MLSVLVVDRESDIRGLFETILKRMGHRVNIKEFLDNNGANNEKYDLIILDLGPLNRDTSHYSMLIQAGNCVPRRYGMNQVSHQA